MDRFDKGLVGFALSADVDDNDIVVYRTEIVSKLKSIFKNESILGPYIEECLSYINNKEYTGEYMAKNVIDSSLILSEKSGDMIHPYLKIIINLTKK